MLSPLMVMDALSSFLRHFLLHGYSDSDCSLCPLDDVEVDANIWVQNGMNRKVTMEYVQSLKLRDTKNIQTPNMEFDVFQLQLE